MGCGADQRADMSRVSVDNDDPDFANYDLEKFMDCKVYVDDVLHRFVFTVDVLAGTVEVADLNESGDALIDEKGIKRKTIKGKVRVLLRDGTEWP